MYSKLQHGIQSEEYLQRRKILQVDERLWFDWYDFIVIQITAR